MSWKHHIAKVQTKLSQATAMICHSKKILPKAIRILLYKLLVVSQLEYYLPIWGGASKSLINPLFRTQKTALRVALAAPYNSHTDPLFAILKTLKLQYNLAKIGREIVNNIAPPGVRECFAILHPDEKRRSRTHTSLLIPSCPADFLQRNTAYTVPKTYNNAPEFSKS
jgi:hypothetical protein